MTKARPILFSAPMIRTLLDGRKTQTRRIAKRQPAYPDSFSDVAIEMADGAAKYFAPGASLPFKILVCPYGRPGDLLWVRETFDAESRTSIYYRADGWGYDDDPNSCWKPSIFMPRWASRLTLEITDVRAERLQDITDIDAQAEGCAGEQRDVYFSPYEQYAELWDALKGRGAWNKNPWVWALNFNVHLCNVDALLAREKAA